MYEQLPNSGGTKTSSRSTPGCERVRVGIHPLDPGMVRIDGVRFIGATLCTDLVLDGKADETGTHMRTSREVADFRGSIQHPGRDFTTGESVERLRWDRAFIERELEQAECEGERAVVITHHTPTPRSVRPWKDL